MAQRKLELLVGAALIAGVASYGWIYHFSKDESNAAGIADAVVNEISELSGVKVAQSDFSPQTLSDPFTHLAINGETWISQTKSHFEASESLPGIELPELPLPEVADDAWYSPTALKNLVDANVSEQWENIKADAQSLFSSDSE